MEKPLLAFCARPIKKIEKDKISCGYIFLTLTLLLLSECRTWATPVPVASIHQFSDPSGNSSFQQIQGKPIGDWLKVTSPNFGKQGGYGWVKFPLHSAENQSLWIEVQSHFIDSLTIFITKDVAGASNVITTMSGFDHQPIKHRYFLFPVSLEKNENYVIFLKGFVRAPDVLKIPVAVWKPRSFLEYNRVDNWGWALFVGAMLVAIILSLINFGLKYTNISYLYFAGYVGFINAYALLNDGWGFFLPSFLNYLDQNTLLGHWVNIGIGCFMLFSGKFLNIQESKRKLLAGFNPLFITLAVEVAIFVVHLGEWTNSQILFFVGYNAGLILAFGYLLCWLLFVKDAVERGFKPVWLHVASAFVFISFFCLNTIFVNTGFLTEAIPDMLVLRYAIAIDIVVILISWVYRQRVVEQQNTVLEIEYMSQKRTVEEAIYRQRMEELKSNNFEKEIQIQRVRLARDLHDGIGSELTHIINRLDILAFKSNQQQPLLSLGDFTRATNQNLRDTLWILNQENITAQQWYERTLAWLTKVWEDRETPQLHTEFNYADVFNLGPTVANTIFRVTQEAVNNALKYADAEHIVFSLLFQNTVLILTISDNGKGFDPEQIRRGYGLANMQARTEELGGKFALISDKQGTVIRVELPVV
ncbi:MAG: 7TM-DISM domain-containing protein [Dyadobacter sp.]|uniref:sensor histidine kinase n=1 Tax=Dyadobacter sp. TaxID=1914288 RepID=UPI003264DB06